MPQVGVGPVKLAAESLPTREEGRPVLGPSLEAAAIFLNPGPAGLLAVWQYAGPACSCKASALARGAGPVLNPGRGGLLGEPSALPWEDWWPQLAGCSLMAQLRSGEEFLSLDRAWVSIRARPDTVNAPTPQGKPLLVAVMQGRRAIAELLCRSGAALSRRVADELLHEAASRGGEATVSLLLCDARGAARADPWAGCNARPTRHGGTPLDAAAARGHAACVRLLRAVGGRHSLHWAATHALPEDVAAWLAEGADVDERDGSGATALWLAVRGARGAARGAEGPRKQCVELLLEARATVDALPITLETPLLIAAASGSVLLATKLLAARADPTMRDRSGQTPLQRAGHAAVRELLTCAGTAGTHSLDMEPVATAPGASRKRAARSTALCSVPQSGAFKAVPVAGLPWGLVDLPYSGNLAAWGEADPGPACGPGAGGRRDRQW